MKSIIYYLRSMVEYTGWIISGHHFQKKVCNEMHWPTLTIQLENTFFETKWNISEIEVFNPESWQMTWESFWLKGKSNACISLWIHQCNFYWPPSWLKTSIFNGCWLCVYAHNIGANFWRRGQQKKVGPLFPCAPQGPPSPCLT